MRRDVYISNDSGGFSIVAHDALDAIIEDERGDDFRFVREFKAMLLLLYGDDSLPVRIVVDEALTDDEQAQWLAQATWRIDAADGRLLVMGGFDPDVMQWWKDETGGAADGEGVAIVDVPPGSLRIDIYAHVGSMNGRHILSEADEKLGAAFRRSHPGRPFPLWLAHMLDHDDRDPGFDAQWKNSKQSVASGELSIDTDGAAAIGFVVHVQRLQEPLGDPPVSGWFDLDTGARIPKVFPLGLPSGVADPDLDDFRDRLLGREPVEAPLPIVTTKEAIVDAWDGDPPAPIRGNTPPLAVRPDDAHWLYWIAALTSEATPAFEFVITPKLAWTPPASTTEFAVESKGGKTISLGPSADNQGWWLWFASRSVAATLADVPDGSVIDLATKSRSEDEADPAIGRSRYRGTVRVGAWEVTEASPAVDRDTLADALEFVKALLVDQKILVRTAAERDTFEKTVAMYFSEEGSVVLEGDAARLKDPEERMLLMLAAPVFRARFGTQWPCDADEEDDD